MNMCTKALATACVALLVMTAAAECAQGDPQGDATSDCQQVVVDRFENLSGYVMEDDDEIIQKLVQLREEEKLARDVYLTYAALYDVPLFSSTALTEQNHMDLVAMILKRYGIADPSAGKGIGEFENPKLQDLFDDLLVPMGEGSFVGALSAGAIIEDLDIFHLEDILLESTFLDVNLIVEIIVAGSRNHLRGFVGALEQRGETYFPPFYIDKDYLSLILSSETESPVIHDEYGEVLAECAQRLARGDRS